MRRPTFVQGAAVALVLALVSGSLFSLAAAVAGSSLGMRALMAVVAFGYLAFLLSRSRERTGRLTVTALWLVATTLMIVLDASHLTYALTHVLMLWLVRSLYFHSGLIAALLDLGLNALAVGAFAWAAAETQSVFLSVWCFFLVQALFVLIPARVGTGRTAAAARAADGRFDQAERNAEAALRRLLAHRPQSATP